MGWARGLLEREAMPIAVIATWLVLLVIEMPRLLVTDSWMTLVDGRYVSQHGLPSTDSLAVWTHGRTWVDQQWGAQLAFYEAATHGDLRAVLLVGIACIGVALVLIAIAARRLGASSRNVAIGVALPVLCAPWVAEVRAQSFAVPLFVSVYALLAADSRSPGRRVLLVLPLLVVWANLHGSVALGAGLVALYGLGLLRRSDARIRAALLVAGAPLTLLASPYGTRLVGYYHVMLLHPPLARYVSEWQPAGVAVVTAPFFASVLIAAALWGAHRRRLTGFERWAMVLLLVAALTAIRNAVWFELALAIGLPRLLDGAWPSQIALTAPVRRLNLMLGCGAVAVVLAAATGVTALHSAAWFDSAHRPGASATVAAVAGSRGVVLADQVDVDWLLWKQPSLAGRVAYDVRFELLDARELKQIQLLGDASHPVWRRCASRARVVTFPSIPSFRAAEREGVLARGAKVVLRTPTFIVVTQPPVAGFCKL